GRREGGRSPRLSTPVPLNRRCEASSLRAFLVPVEERGLGRSARRWLAQHEPVAVLRSHAKLAHSPRLVRGWFQDLSASVTVPVVESLDVVDTQIRHVAVIAELRCGHGLRTAPEHEVDRAGTTERPATGIRIAG